MAVFNSKRLAMTSAVALIAACTVADSESVRTSGMAAYMEVVAEGDGTVEVDVWLAAGSGFNAARIELQGDDRLLANNGVRTQQLSKKFNLVGLSYGTTLDGDSVNRRYQIDFERSIDASTHSWTNLPEPFEITFPDARRVVTGEGVDLEWQTSDAGSLRLMVDFDCHINQIRHSFRRTVTTVPDDGHAYLNLVERMADEHADPYSYDNCDVTVVLDSRQNGQLDVRFGEGGYIYGIQRRSRNFSFQPQRS